MSKLQPARGTHDLIFQEARKHLHILEVSRELATQYGFDEIETPIFEHLQVFTKTLGDTSDIVSKEMYVFKDKGDETLTLRPEGTAGVVRAFLSNGLQRSLPCRFFYQGPMFRYERPQKGRYRQFHQIGVEVLGVENPMSDVELISMGQVLFERLEISEKIFLEINSIGDADTRRRYKEALVEYYKKHLSSLSEDSQRRLQTNPLRILDSKDRKDLEINEGAPKFAEHLNSDSQKIFAYVQEALTQLEIPFQVNPKLVRGLDYYNHTVFEFKTTALGSQDAVLSGGRYDSLVEMMGGPGTPGVGWAAGIERLCLLLDKAPEKTRPITLVPVTDEAEKYALKISHELRQKGLPIEMTYSGNLSNRMKKASKINSEVVIIIGEQELETETLTVKHLDSGTQSSVKKEELMSKIIEFLSK